MPTYHITDLQWEAIKSCLVQIGLQAMQYYGHYTQRKWKYHAVLKILAYLSPITCMTVDIERSEIRHQLLFISSSTVEQTAGEVSKLEYNKHFNSRAMQHIAIPTFCTAIRAWGWFSHAQECTHLSSWQLIPHIPAITRQQLSHVRHQAPIARLIP